MPASRKYSVGDEDFRRLVAESLSVAQIIVRMGLVPAGGNYKTVQQRIQQLALDTSHFTGSAWNSGTRHRNFGRTLSLAVILVEDSTYTLPYRLRTLVERGIEAAAVRTIHADALATTAYPTGASSCKWGK